MANYRPLAKIITAVSASVEGSILSLDLSVSTWGMYVLEGTVLDNSDSPLASATIKIWLSVTTSGSATGDPDKITFSDVNGVYGITMPTGVPYYLEAVSP